MPYTDTWIVESLRRRMAENLELTNEWRMNEVMENYLVMQNIQWTMDQVRRMQADGIEPQTLNVLAPVINSIAGFEVQNRFDVKYVPRLLDDEQEHYTDILNSTVAYIKQNANADIETSYAFKDMLTCGLGATDAYMSYDNNPNGEIVVERVFPGFIFYDITARAKNLTDSAYVVRIKIVPKDTFKEDYGLEYGADIFPSDLDPNVIQYFNNTLMSKDLATIYEYQWRDKEKFWRIRNPFMQIKWDELDDETFEFYQGLAEGLAETYEFDVQRDPVFSVFDSSVVSALRKIFKQYPMNFKLEVKEQTHYKYYRAMVTGDRVLEKSENFSQTGFSMKFMTGEYSELRQYYFGLVSSAKIPQRLLNQVFTDFVAYLATIPKGGVEIEASAVPNLQDFVQNYTKARYVTIYSEGALSEGRVRPKLAAPFPQGIMEMIQQTKDLIMQTCGVTPEFMGMMSTKEMTASLNRQIIRQVMTTLAPYFDAKRTYDHHQARLYIDTVRILADNIEGTLIRNVTGEGDAKYFKLLKSNIAAEYDIVVEDVPETQNERQETLEKLLMAMQMFGPAGQALIPAIITKLPIDLDAKKEVQELMKPPEAPQPDPVAQALLEAEVQSRQADAKRAQADADKKILDIENDNTDREIANAKTMTEIALNQARIKQLNGEKANEYRKNGHVQSA